MPEGSIGKIIDEKSGLGELTQYKPSQESGKDLPVHPDEQRIKEKNIERDVQRLQDLGIRLDASGAFDTTVQQYVRVRGKRALVHKFAYPKYRNTLIWSFVETPRKENSSSIHSVFITADTVASVE